jgi:proton-dependent oligopeptide transporter, POT family
MATTTNLLTKTNLKHPAGLWGLSWIYSLFMCAFGSLLASITLYLLHGLHFSQTHAYTTFGAYASLLWTLPLAGGYLAGRYGYRTSAVIGIVLSIIGTACLGFQNRELLYVGLAAFVVGNAYFTSAVWCMVDHLYGKDDRLRETGFTLFYLLFNIGAVLGIFLGGYMDSAFGYGASFFLVSGFCVISLISLAIIVPRLRFGEGRFLKPQATHPTFRAAVHLSSAAIILIACAILLIHYAEANQGLTIALSLVAVVSLLFIASREKVKRKRLRIYAFTVLCFFSLFFWTLYNLEPSLLSVFIDHQVNKSFFGLHIPASDFLAFEGSFVVINGILLSRFWTHLAKQGKDISLPIKFGLSLLFIGLGYLFLFIVVHAAGPGHIMGWAMIWCYGLFALGELFLGPLGMSMVGTLSPAGLEGYFMGVWQLFMGFGGIAAGWIAVFAVVPHHSTLLAERAIYGHLFLKVGVAGVCLALLMFACAPAITKLIRD